MTSAQGNGNNTFSNNLGKHLSAHPGSSPASGHVRHHEAQPVLITSAPMTPDEEFHSRQRRYATLMALRVVCVIVAVSVAGISVLLSLAFMVGGAVLPWCAVLIANDRLPLTRTKGPGAVAQRTPTALGTGPQRIVEL